MQGTPSPESVSTRLQRIAELARKAPDLAFTTLAHYIDLELLHEGLPEDPEGWRDRNRRPDGDRLRGKSAGEPAVAAEPVQVWDVPGTASPTGTHSKGGRQDASAHRDTNLRGQSPVRGRSRWCWR